MIYSCLEAAHLSFSETEVRILDQFHPSFVSKFSSEGCFVLVKIETQIFSQTKYLQVIQIVVYYLFFPMTHFSPISVIVMN